MSSKRIRSSTDRISDLPDAIRSYVISLLPAEDAVRSCLLSSQWRHMFSSLSRLEFNQQHFEDKGEGGLKFTEFVDRVLLSHDESRVDKFILTVKFDDALLSTDHLSKWISFAARHCVREFDLHGRPESKRLDTLPSCFFTFASLNKLFVTGIDLNLPTKLFCFPLLVKLEFLRTTFRKPFSISNCPKLRKLLIKNCSMHRLTISSHSLTSLAIDDSNLKPKIKLCIPNIKKLSYSANVPPRINKINSLSSLRNAYFYIRAPFTMANRKSFGAFVGTIRKWLPNSNVEKLGLDTFYIDFFMRYPKLFESTVAVCANLKKLKLSYVIEDHVPGIRLLLRSYPNLEHLVLTFRVTDCNIPNIEPATDGYWESKVKSAGVTFKYLKTVQFRNFGGTESELDLVRYLLETATVLERLNIRNWHDKKINEANRINVRQKMMAFPRASTGSVISVCH